GKNLRAFALYQPEIYKNLRLDVRVVNQSEAPYALNLVCRYSERDGWYQYEVFDTGAYNLYYFVWDKDKKAASTLLAEGVAESMARGEANEIGLSCNDRDLSLYVNDRLVRAYPENQYVLRDGKAGIGVTSFDQIPVLVAFDWLKIGAP
ncbi:MAG: hypothetical protein AB1750_02460, partial [Chloroflexota bacterium]